MSFTFYLSSPRRDTPRRWANSPIPSGKNATSSALRPILPSRPTNKEPGSEGDVEDRDRAQFQFQGAHRPRAGPELDGAVWEIADVGEGGCQIPRHSPSPPGAFVSRYVEWTRQRA